MFKVYLAMEAGYMEKVDELCERYSLDRFLDIKGKAVSIDQQKFIKKERKDYSLMNTYFVSLRLLVVHSFFASKAMFLFGHFSFFCSCILKDILLFNIALLAACMD